jgi:hypothetical protein
MFMYFFENKEKSIEADDEANTFSKSSTILSKGLNNYIDRINKWEKKTINN